MKNLPNNFLTDLQKITKINPQNLSRYLSGLVIPRPDRAIELSSALKVLKINIPPEDFVFNNKKIKKNILKQLEAAA